MANPFGGFGNKQGFKGFGQTQGTNVTIDQLLAAARLQGGAVAEVAEELTDPRRS
jgi:hypothetical protein